MQKQKFETCCCLSHTKNTTSEFRQAGLHCRGRKRREKSCFIYPSFFSLSLFALKLPGGRSDIWKMERTSQFNKERPRKKEEVGKMPMRPSGGNKVRVERKKRRKGTSCRFPSVLFPPFCVCVSFSFTDLNKAKRRTALCNNDTRNHKKALLSFVFVFFYCFFSLK